MDAIFESNASEEFKTLLRLITRNSTALVKKSCCFASLQLGSLIFVIDRVNGARWPVVVAVT